MNARNSLIVAICETLQIAPAKCLANLSTEEVAMWLAFVRTRLP
jgi:hypothetical protein